MSKKRDALNDVRIRMAKPKEKPYKMADGGGLYLFVTPAGGKLWRMDQRNDQGRWNTLSLGAYPQLSLAEARGKREEVKKQRSVGRDPAAVNRILKIAQGAKESSFEVVAREWHAKNLQIWTPRHGERVMKRLCKEIFPYIGTRTVQDLTAPEILEVCKRVEDRGFRGTAHRVLQTVGTIIRYAAATGRATSDPTTFLRGALAPYRERNRPAVTNPKEIALLLRALDSYRGDPVTRAALRLTPLLMLRPGKLRHLEWSEIDVEAAEIRIPAEKMKMRSPHIVPLARQALAVLSEIRQLTGQGRYVFPSARKDGKAMSDNTVRSALIRLGYTGDVQTAHGFRATASTRLNEMGYHRDAIERQLSHAERNRVRAAYNHAEYLSDRRRMMQDWADYLDKLRGPAE